MMTIEGVMRLRGSEMDLYSPQYFESAKQLTDMILGGSILLYGQEVVDLCPTVVTLDGERLIPHLDALDFYMEDHVFKMDTANKEYETLANGKKKRIAWFTDKSWWINYPPIPPDKGYIAPNRLTNMRRLQSRYLHERDETAPRYCFFDHDTNNLKIIENTKAGSKDLLLGQTHYTRDLKNSVYFVNGLCCRAEVETNDAHGEQVRLKDGMSFLRNQADRHRGIVIADFGKQCEVQYFTTKYFAGQFPSCSIDAGIDVPNSSFLLVVDGRLYLPGEFTVYNDHTMKIRTSFNRPEYVLDRLCCQNKFVGQDGDMATTRTLMMESVNYKDANNSFLIVFGRPGLRVIRHACHSPANVDFLPGRMSQHQQHKLIFNASAQGLLFDTSTRSVVDYVREESDMTFYDDKGDIPKRWNIVSAYVNECTRLEMWGKCNNDMSASASMHDRSDARGSAFVLQPKYTMLDFIFEG